MRRIASAVDIEIEQDKLPKRIDFVASRRHSRRLCQKFVFFALWVGDKLWEREIYINIVVPL
jgi:hypothetical protein